MYVYCRFLGNSRNILLVSVLLHTETEILTIGLLVALPCVFTFVGLAIWQVPLACLIYGNKWDQLLTLTTLAFLS